MSKNGSNGGRKKIPAAKIIEQFLKLPEKKRTELLRANLSDEALYAVGELEFQSELGELKKQDPKTIRSFLTNNSSFDGPWQDLIPLGEDIAGNHLDSIYTRFKVPKEGAKDEDKLYALVMCNDLSNRLRVFWDGVKGGKREQYIDTGLSKIDKTDLVSRFMGDTRNYAPGKSFGSFADGVMKAADLSQEKSVIGHLNDAVPQDDPRREEKLQRAAQICMIKNETFVDPERIAADLQRDDWEKKVDPRKALKEEIEETAMRHDMVGRMKTAVETIPENEEEKAIFQEAALQTCKDFKRAAAPERKEEPSYKELIKYNDELHCDIAKRELGQKSVRDIREKLAAEYKTLEKEKSGWFLSKTNTQEYNEMMKGVRLFNAKLDILNGQEPVGLSPEELKTVNETGAETLFNNAKRGCYNYGCLKTANGTDSIIHDSGNERFKSNMNTLAGLNELGLKLRLCEPAVVVRDEAQREILMNRRNKTWMAENVEDLAAKTIYAQTLINKGVPEATQKRLLEEGALNAQVEKIKSNSSFKEMVRTIGHKGIADAMIKGVGSLAAAYQKAVVASQSKGVGAAAPELDPAEVQPKEHSAGLTVPVKK